MEDTKLTVAELRAELVPLLRTQIMELTFTKKDGSERVMHATLRGDVVPVYEGTGTPRKENPEVLPVFDVELKEWRSFRLDSLKKVTLSSLKV